MQKNILNKIILIAALIFLLNSTQAIIFGGETEDVNFGRQEYSSVVRQGENFYINVQLLNSDLNALEGYHAELKVVDSRRALINDYSVDLECNEIECIEKRILSDANGMIHFAFPINSCNAFQKEFCYNIGQIYTFKFNVKGNEIQDTFEVMIEKQNTHWFGDILRWFVVNTPYLFILGCASILLLFGIITLKRAFWG